MIKRERDWINGSREEKERETIKGGNRDFRTDIVERQEVTMRLLRSPWQRGNT